MQRIIIVSNRLPFTVNLRNGNITLEKSVGGLTSGVEAYAQSLKRKKWQYLWIGWPDVPVCRLQQREQVEHVLISHNISPVYLSTQQKEKFYDGFCNKTLWPLFHYFPAYAAMREDYWQSYQTVNRIFADAVAKEIKRNDIVFIQDYHLMLLPKMLRKKFPKIPVGFFLHIPFPSYETFRLLPTKWRTEILEGVLGADLIGFHTSDYTQYFQNCVLRILGIDHNLSSYRRNGTIIKTDTFPLGIDVGKITQTAQNRQSRKIINELEKTIRNQKVVLSVDRLDYTKGIANRLAGFEFFLEKNYAWRERIILILILTPSRTSIESYRQMKKNIDEYVGRINGKFGTMGWIPVRYQYTSLPFDELVAYYRRADIALVTPLRDGMNLVAKEYVAAHKDSGGVLILSETAGSSKDLREAVIINPRIREEISNALTAALDMPIKEQKKLMYFMNRRLAHNTVIKWGDDFFHALAGLKREQEKLASKIVNSHVADIIAHAYHISKQRLIFLDYDGTLMPFTQIPSDAKPSGKVIRLLKTLSKDPENTVVLISGRVKSIMEEWFNIPELNLAAEHGVFVKERDSTWLSQASGDDSWKKYIFPILKRFKEWLPGSEIEEKAYSLAFHYRNIPDRYMPGAYEKELHEELIRQTANMNTQVLKGNKVIEVKSTRVNKGTAAKYWLTRNKYDFILALGDDVTDEDLFSVLPADAFSIKVGIDQTKARFLINGPLEVQSLLKKIAWQAIS